MKNLIFRGAMLLCCLFGLTRTANAQVDLYMDSLNVYVSEYGKIELYTLPDTIMQIDRITPLVGTAIGQVFDNREDADVLDSTILVSKPAFSDFEIYGAYNNNYSGLPPNVVVKENIYCWKSQNSILIKYTVINKDVAAMNEVLGFELIPQVENAYSGTDTVTYNSQTKIFSDRKTQAVGFKFLNGDINSLNTFVYYKGYNTDTLFWNWMTNGIIDTLFVTDPNDPNVDDPVIIPSFKSKALAVGDSAVYYVAVGYGLNKATMLYNMQLAEQKYSKITAIKTKTNLNVTGYRLSANYPNPFNPTTRIEYQIPQRGHVTLKVYNTLGNEVATLVNSEKAAGKYVVDFSAEKLTSGIYYYTIQAGSFHETGKMMLLK